MAEKIKIDNKPIDEGMKEAGEKAQALEAEDGDVGPGHLAFGGGADALDAATGDAERALTLDKDALPPGSGGSELETARDDLGETTQKTPQSGFQAQSSFKAATDSGTDGSFDDAFGAGTAEGLAVEHGVSIPPQGFDQVEHVDADVDAAAGATGDGGFAPPDVETDVHSVDVAGGMLGHGELTPTDVEPEVDPVDADIA